MNSKPLLWIVALVVAIAAGWQLASAQGEKEKAAQKWEYKAMNGGQEANPDRYMKEVEKLGNEGWELVAVEPATRYARNTTSVESGYRVFHFKRPK